MEEIVRRNKIRKLPSDRSTLKSASICILLLNSTLYVNKNKNEKRELITEINLFGKESQSIGEREVRPDIIHNSLLMLLDSPLCKAGYLSEIIILNQDGKLLKIDPKFRVPRSFKVFSKVFSEFLSSPNGELRLPDGMVVLSIKNETIEEFLSGTEVVVGFSRVAKREDFQEFMKEKIKNVLNNENIKKLIFVIGAASKGSVCDIYSSFYSHYISICDISMPTYICCSKICSELEEVLEIL
ncbi:hypothetical protein FG386_000814 [Cryptosporidium ryanae]|uniref:uncharacterized protein n=1 Tax=Cryptosporidium ryanae TaxID=515981 RepID=UPI00351A9675|nr:hypothetical protein FG386_000814 [Cryptosporidium ryanae]